jgi:chemotaxis signal transduction protein
LDKETDNQRLGLTLSVLPDESEGLDSTSDHDQPSVVRFTVGGSSFAVGVEFTEGVVDCPRISPLPAPPEGIIGVVSVRGRITVVMDLSLSVDLGVGRRRLILLKGDAQLGLLADRIDGVFPLPAAPKKSRGRRKNQLKVAGTRSGAKRWPTITYLRTDADRIPVLDIERLTMVGS